MQLLQTMIREVATKKLETILKHREQQSKVRVDIAKKREIAFNKFLKTAKKNK